MISDVVEFELFKNALHSIADEMGLTLLRTSYSGVLRGNMDFAPAIFDASGTLVAQGVASPGHLGSMPAAFAALRTVMKDGAQPGDVFILNDPYHGGSHLPDVFVFKPIFHAGRLLAYGAAVSHHTDVGGRVPGSNAADSTEIFQEGLRIPPLKLYDRGARNETLFSMIETNVRVPVKFFGDLRAQMAACHTCEQGLLDLAARYGEEKIQRYMMELVDYSDRMTRAAIRELPDGVYTFVDHLDDDGIDRGQPIRLQVSVTKSGDRVIVDWTGSAPQVKGAINSPLSYTQSSSYCAIQCILPTDIPHNEGVYRAIEVRAPAGTIANPVLPAPCAARALTGFRMGDCLFGALSQMLPDKVFACSDGGNTGVTMAGYDPSRKPFIYVDFICGAWGGRPYADGVDGISSIYANLGSHSVEVAEAEQPLQIMTYEFIRDAMGPGKFRGGAPFRRDYKLLNAEGILQVRSDRRAFRPYGLYGGGPGRASMNYLNPDQENRVLPTKVTMNIQRGDVLRHELAGAGGWGDPLERDPDKVRIDVRNEFVSLESARDDYGVVLLQKPLRVEEQATLALRARLRRERNWSAVPVVSWESSRKGG
jgi:N-methylhydantoinase B